jgi:hypothetical protein
MEHCSEPRRANCTHQSRQRDGNFSRKLWQPPNLGTTGQNIRFAQDGNLYVSNTSTNTDIYRINTTNGAATWMGEAVGFPYLMLMNASSNMYGVYINLGSSTNSAPKLATFDLSSFVNWWNQRQWQHSPITINLVGAGTNFPANFNFSGNVPQAVTNLTVPVSATGPSNQTTVVGSNVVFSTVASGTGPYNYAWSKNGAAMSSQTNSSLTLSNVTTNDAAPYSVIVGGAMGTVTNSATLTVNVPVTVTVPPANQTAVVGNNVTFSVTATGTGLSYQWLFNGSVIGATNSLTLNNVTVSQAGVYTVIMHGAVGSATNSATLTVNKATGTVTLGNLNQTYSGSAEAATATTIPTGLTVNFTYNNSANAPTNAGSYTVIGTINDPNYAGSVTNTLVIAQAGATVTLGNLIQTYSGSAEAATATTTPTGLMVIFTYNGSVTVPTNAGSYTVIGTINNPNYTGSATNTLVIAQASGSITLGSLNQTYTGAAKAATATTTPSGLTVSFTYNGSATVPTNAGSYTVIGTINDANYQGSATNTLVIAQASGSITLGSLSQTYSGTAKPATATTTPTGLTVNFTYNGSANVPTNAGSYTVIGTINDANYQGSATNTLVIAQASGAITLGSLSQTYNGTAKPATATTVPTGLTVSFTYNGSANVPTNAGSYTVIGTINDANYQGSATNTLVIAQASGAITLGSLNQTYTARPKPATATTTPSGLTVSFTYNGSANVPTNAGSYTVIGTINDANYQGSATNTLVIAQASGAITLGSLNQTYTGAAKPATATTTPSGLTVSFTYNGSANVPTNAGSYTVIGTINDANYQGSATNTLVIAQASGAVTLGSLNQTYTGAAKPATATTTPSGLAVSFTYNGSANVPTNAGSYTVIGAINDANYQGSATNTLVIAQASGSITLGSLNQTYTGAAKAATAGTTPSGLTVNFTYNGSANVPTNAGSYTVIGTINDANYQGSATNTLVIAQASGAITLGSLSQTYTGAAKPATATTTPTGLTVSFTYNGSANVPTNAGSYTVIGTINDANYQGSATNMLVIAQASGAVTLGSLNQTYTGAAKPATATTTPSGLAVNFTYNGSANVPTNAGSYTVIGAINDANYQGSATNTLVIAQASGSITLGSLNQTYTGAAKAATAGTTPSGLTVNFTYNGSANVPTNAGSYTVIGTINDANYQGSATNTLVIAQASGSITLGNLSQTYNGTAKPATATTVPTGLTVSFTYNGSANVPTNAGSYTVIGTINDANYQGSATNTLVIAQASGAITLGSLSQTYTGAAKPATATTTPTGLTVSFTYNGSANVPTNAGSYTVIGTINDANYQGSATNTLVIAQASGAITLGSLNQTYTGAAKPATATTTPTGLTVSFTYNGSANVPTNVGSYTVIGTINDANYQGSATNMLVIAQASGSITLGSLNQTYSGTAKPATATTVPSGLAVSFTYNGSATVPTSAGSYTVIGTINDANYQGSATNTLVIAQASGAITLGSLSQTYNGTAKPATATTIPTGLTVNFTYNGSANAPTNAGSYTVIGTINDANYQGSATNTLVIAQASGAITLGSLNQTYRHGQAGDSDDDSEWAGGELYLQRFGHGSDQRGQLHGDRNDQ